MDSLMGKARKPKFELHLKIYDLNNVPLVSGSSFIKWHLAHSMHAEHRGRTKKCPISNHKVDYGFGKIIHGIRIAIDKNNSLTDCPLELEVVQEFGHTDKITLGHVKLNLSEYVEESETFIKEVVSPGRGRSNSIGVSPMTAAKALGDDIQDGIVRRYLMQDSKVNSTLKLGVLMVQMDGDRNFSAPPLRTAPVFGGIAGFTAADQPEDETQGPIPSISKPRDAAEVQDLYRRTLAASWYRQPNELPADECIEDIFSGGNGWCTRQDNSATPDSEDDDDDATDSPSSIQNSTLRPRDFRKLNLSNLTSHSHHSHSHNHHLDIRHHFGGHRRTNSGSSDKSVSTVTGKMGSGNSNTRRVATTGSSMRSIRDVDSHSDSMKESLGRNRRGSLTSMTPTLGSKSSLSTMSSGRSKDREVAEHDARDDLVAWRLPGGLTAA